MVSVNNFEKTNWIIQDLRVTIKHGKFQNLKWIEKILNCEFEKILTLLLHSK